jgi:hypothetical protein
MDLECVDLWADSVRDNGAEIGFWPKTDEVTEDWRTLYNEEINDLYFTPNTIPTVE